MNILLIYFNILFKSKVVLSVYLGNTKREIIRDVTAPYTIYSVNITTENTDGLFIEGLITSDNDFINVSSISVKEIITLNEVKWTPRTTFDLNKILKYIRRIFTKEQPRNVEIIFRHG